jgi:hypothetical protein
MAKWVGAAHDSSVTGIFQAGHLGKKISSVAQMQHRERWVLLKCNSPMLQRKTMNILQHP